MFINDIEFAIRLWIDDEDGNELFHDTFLTFEELNKFLKSASTDEKYDFLTAEFCLVEVINGVPEEHGSFFYEISPIMEISDDEIEDYYYDFNEDLKFSEEVSENMYEPTDFIPKDDAEDYESKKVHRDDMVYICPFCFREVDDCRCKTYSYYLVQVDKLLIPIVRTLNRKGYTTSACCSGHLKDNHCRKIYIAFKEDHNFGTNIPEGSSYSKSGRSVNYDWKFELSEEELKNYQLDCIKKIEEWAEKLPPLK